MGHCAQKHQKRRFGHLLRALAFSVVLLPVNWRCSAGLTELNLLPHEQLHKGRGISEEYNHTSGKLSPQRNTSSQIRSQAANGQASRGKSAAAERTPAAAGEILPQKSSRTQAQNSTGKGQASAVVATAIDLLTQRNVSWHADNTTADSHDTVKKPAIAAFRGYPEPPPRSKKLDVVLSHFHPSRVQPALDFWLDFLQSDKVQQWNPYVWLYCQNENMTAENMEALLPLLRFGGEIVHLENIGRESHSFLHHIIGHFGDLADYTLFSQDIPEAVLVDRFEKLFDNRTGFLPLSMVGHVDCNDEWLPGSTIPQLYSMLTRSLCPPEGYTAAFQGQFIVSRRRVLDQDWWVYKNLLDVLAAPLDHWVHEIHDNEHFKDRSNPFFGHVLERAWSLAFNCYESWRHGNCWWCEQDMHLENCGTDACQCMDHE